ncbi:Hypothetical protein, putative, partial [Bodo saltans]
MFSGSNSWRSNPSAGYTSGNYNNNNNASQNRRAVPTPGQLHAPPQGNSRHLSPPYDSTVSATPPHRYDVRNNCAPTAGGDSASRGGSLPGVSGSRSTQRGGSSYGHATPQQHAAPYASEYATPYSTRRSPTQLRYFEPHERSPAMGPAVAATPTEYSPPPPLYQQQQHYNPPSRGSNLFDQDQLPEMSPHTRAPPMHPPHGGARSASAAATGLHHPHYGIGR